MNAVERALSILDAFVGPNASRSLAELARATGLVKPTVLRSLVSLERLGYVARMGDGRYQLGAKVMQLGAIYRGNFRLDAYLLPVLQRLAEATRENATFHIREGDKRLSLYRVESPQAVREVQAYPTLTDLDDTAPGQVLSKSDWAEETARGHPIVYRTSGIYDAQTASAATAVFGLDGRLVGALTISGPVGRMDRARVGEIADGLAQAAHKLSLQLGAPYREPPGPVRIIGPSGHDDAASPGA